MRALCAKPWVWVENHQNFTPEGTGQVCVEVVVPEAGRTSWVSIAVKLAVFV